MDSALLRICEEADRGEEVAQLRVITAAGVIYGTPVGSEEAIRIGRSDIEEQLFTSGKPKRRDRERTGQLYSALASKWVEPLRPLNGSASDALSLREARVIFFGVGETFETPLLRVPISSVTAWFMGGSRKWISAAYPVGNATPDVVPPADIESRVDLLQ